MKCFNCSRDHEHILLFKLPVEFLYTEHNQMVIGNAEEGEFICVACIGYLWDDAVAKEGMAG
jgi:hypothetical protein